MRRILAVMLSARAAWGQGFNDAMEGVPMPSLSDKHDTFASHIADGDTQSAACRTPCDAEGIASFGF